MKRQLQDGNGKNGRDLNVKTENDNFFCVRKRQIG
jgi:hypothetical protein